MPVGRPQGGLLQICFDTQKPDVLVTYQAPDPVLSGTVTHRVQQLGKLLWPEFLIIEQSACERI